MGLFYENKKFKFLLKENLKVKKEKTNKQTSKISNTFSSCVWYYYGQIKILE